jgi:pimeloyl-ACP methyl ester carboxylesterase
MGDPTQPRDNWRAHAAPRSGRFGGGRYHRVVRTQRIAVADGVELAADTWPPSGGNGVPAFVLVHGLASNARLWDGVAAALTALGHLVVAVDLRGHGRSSKPDGPYDVPTVASDVATLIERLDLDRPIVAGQSWGGNVVVELAATRPELVRGIVCVDGGWLEPSRSFPDWETCRAALAPPRLAGRPLSEIEAHIRSAHPDWPETGIQGTLANFERRPDGTIAPWLTFDRHIAVLRGLWEHHPSALFGRLAVPVLLAPADSGGHEWAARKRDDVAAAASAIPRHRVTWFHGDHDIQAQHPDELAGAMHGACVEGFFG